MKRAVELYRKYGIAGIARRLAERIPYLTKSRDDVRYAFVDELSPITQETYRIGFTPEVPTKNYLITRVCKLLNATPQPFNGNLADYDAVFLWEDKTEVTKGNAALLNGRCTSISKERVAAAFEQVFGYDLGVDPEHFVGAAVLKSDENGMHDGTLVQCPTEPVPGYVFQRVIDNTIGKSVEDLRVTVVGSEVALILRKRRYAYERFKSTSYDVAVLSVADTLSRDEQSKLVELAREIGLDMGDFDVLRDRADGRIYVVDAAKTPFGPLLPAKRESRLELARSLADAFRRQYLATPTL